MDDLPNKTLLRPDEVAKFFGVCVRTIYNWIEKGWLTAYRPGDKSTRITRESCLDHLERTKFATLPP